MVSRSFAAVIQSLDDELKDTDDTTIDVDTKIPYLKSFHEIIYQKGWSFTKNGPNEKDRQLLVEFDIVIDAFLQLKPAYQAIIADITKRMGEGMAHYATAGINVDTIADYDEYCHFVSGLVGYGLSDMFAACGFGCECRKTPLLPERKDLSNAMGLFLQKTNIIADYLEDLHQHRFFWPKEIWGKYCEKLEDLLEPENKEQALQCLNNMLLNAMRLVEDVLEYLSMIKNPSCFKGCALTQVMAIATLNKLYGNYKVFTHENIKIRKGEALWLMKEANNMDAVASIFRLYARKMKNKITSLDPHSTDMGITCDNIEFICMSRYPASTAELRRLRAGVMAVPMEKLMSAAVIRKLLRKA
ncbi:bifunctional farnesyl-diphosphate farnesyltransferase/squalene synthase [Podila horticola]|nr:bifunctional farnesyl-diphosphate farnesyltransferase/squalene synthase [Podila horticola]